MYSYKWQNVSFLFLFILFLFITSLSAQKIKTQKDLSIYLLTVERGTELGAIWSWWGHTAILVRREQANTNIVFDYGLFEGVGLQFFYDQLNNKPVFLLGINSLQNTLSKYKAERRSVWAQRIIAPPQKLNAIYQSLIMNAKPENRNYIYHHFYNNCTTKVRDLLDEVIFDKNLQTKYSQIIGQESIQSKILSKTVHFPPLYFILNLFAGPNIHKEHSTWQDMILPTDLMNTLEQYQKGKEKPSVGPIIALSGNDYVQKTNEIYSALFSFSWLWFLLFFLLWLLLFYAFPSMKIETGKIETGKIETGKIETGKIETGKIETGIFTKINPTIDFLRKMGWWLFYLPLGIFGLLFFYLYFNNPTNPFGYKTSGYNFHLHLIHPFYLLLPIAWIFLRKKKSIAWFRLHRFFLLWTEFGILLAVFLAPYSLPTLFFGFFIQRMLLSQIKRALL